MQLKNCNKMYLNSIDFSFDLRFLTLDQNHVRKTFLPSHYMYSLNRKTLTKLFIESSHSLMLTAFLVLGDAV